MWLSQWKKSTFNPSSKWGLNMVLAVIDSGIDTGTYSDINRASRVFTVIIVLRQSRFLGMEDYSQTSKKKKVLSRRPAAQSDTCCSSWLYFLHRQSIYKMCTQLSWHLHRDFRTTIDLVLGWILDTCGLQIQQLIFLVSWPVDTNSLSK